MNKILNIALFAHVDAGKTTITEQMLYLSGAIKSPGRVDDGTASSDNLEVERERGISVKSSCITIFWKGTQINIIDTPGHKDFSSERDRSISIPDLAVIIISAVEGVQGNTERVWHNLKSAGVPVMVFINKLDRMGADIGESFGTLEKELGKGFLKFQEPQGVEMRNPSLKTLFSKDYICDGVLEKLAEGSDTILEKYLDGVVPEYQLLKNELGKQIKKRQIFPVLFGTALSGGGVEEFMDFIVESFPAVNYNCQAPLGGVIFKIEHRKDIGRTAYMKVLEGEVRNRDQVFNSSKSIEEKVNMLKKVFVSRPEDVKSVKAGDIAMVCGFKTSGVGDVIGNPNLCNKLIEKGESVVKVQVFPRNRENYSQLAEALQVLTDEDPDLQFEWLKDEREFHIKVKGNIQIEVLQGMLRNRFNLDSDFGEPEVIYREALQREVVCSEEYTMPKPCWAVVKFRLAPAQEGEGVIFKSEVSYDKIEHKYQQEIIRCLQDSLKQGPKGWEVGDLVVTLIDGEHHNIHSRSGDFAVATPMAIMKGLVEGGTVLMEPMLNFKIEVDDNFTGKITGDIIQMRGDVVDTSIAEGKALIKALVPVSTSMNYPISFSSTTQGRGVLNSFFGGYRECLDEEGKTRPYKGISPLDRSNFILQARKAF